MKKVISLLSLVLLISLAAASSNQCSLSVSLLSQDPYPATPGEYVKLVFQVEGAQDVSCGDIQFELLEKYPLIFDPNTSGKVSLKAGTFVQDYSSHLIIPYKVRVSPDALNGDNPIEVQFSNRGETQSFLSKEFNLSVQEARVNFEVYVKNFDYKTNTLTLEILNVGKANVQAVTVEVLGASNLTVKGSKTNIIGDLDSNEYTTTDFEVSPSSAIIPMNIYYTDGAGIRRTTTASVSFTPENFLDRKADKKTSSSTPLIIGVVVLIAVGYYFYRKRKKK
ncbi:Uncharacterised protein [uncultured archaeon]|nr:Uncharacterised protein [uncultured archaeon]